MKTITFTSFGIGTAGDGHGIGVADHGHGFVVRFLVAVGATQALAVSGQRGTKLWRCATQRFTAPERIPSRCRSSLGAGRPGTGVDSDRFFCRAKRRGGAIPPGSENRHNAKWHPRPGTRRVAPTPRAPAGWGVGTCGPSSPWQKA